MELHALDFHSAMLQLKSYFFRCLLPLYHWIQLLHATQSLLHLHLYLFRSYSYLSICLLLSLSVSLLISLSNSFSLFARTRGRERTTRRKREIDRDPEIERQKYRKSKMLMKWANYIGWMISFLSSNRQSLFNSWSQIRFPSKSRITRSWESCTCCYLNAPKTVMWCTCSNSIFMEIYIQSPLFNSFMGWKDISITWHLTSLWTTPATGREGIVTACTVRSS